MADRTPARLATLEDVHAAVWRELQQAVGEPGHGWRLPVLATVDGERADARTVVLREVDAGARRLVIYSDARAAKVRQIGRHPHGTVVAWSPALGWQLRCRVLLTVASNGPEANARWARVRRGRGAADYLAAHAPGTRTDVAAAPPPGGDDSHFAMICASVLALDWLELHRDGHRRAVFDDAGARWIQP